MELQNQVILFSGYLSAGKKIKEKSGREYSRRSTFHGIPIALRSEFSSFCKNIGLKGVRTLYRGKSIPGVYDRPQSNIKRQYATSFAVYVDNIYEEFLDIENSKVVSLRGKQVFVNGKVEVVWKEDYKSCSVHKYLDASHWYSEESVRKAKAEKLRKLLKMRDISQAPAYTTFSG